MRNHATRHLSLIAAALACALVAGCATQSGGQTDPVDPIPEAVGPSDSEVGSTPPGGEVPAQQLDADGVPVDPETKQPLARVVYFELDSSVIAPADLRVLERHADFLRASGRSIRVEGHCDERGTREYNLALGERRANAVAEFFIASGVRRSQLPQIVSYGEERPAAVGSDERSWAMNRRAVLQYLR